MPSQDQTPTPASRVRFEPAGEFTLCFLDFQNLRSVEEALSAIAAAKAAVAQTPPFSLRTLTDVEGSHMSLPVIAAMQDMVRANAPHVTKSAVVGLSLTHRVALRQVRRLTGRDIREFESTEAALDYLRS